MNGSEQESTHREEKLYRKLINSRGQQIQLALYEVAKIGALRLNGLVGFN